METVTVATLIAALGDIFTAAVGWVSTVATTITASPILLLFVLVPLVGLGIGMFKRMISVH